MDETNVLIARAREHVDRIIVRAGDLLASGANLKRIHRRYAIAALELLAEAEAQALLADTGDRAARKALEELIVQLARLQAEAESERGLRRGQA